MPLANGVRLGVYEILGFIDAGGMGEVYKARDTRLDRIVAIKVLPARLAADADRRQRFEREARAVGALNHAHICQLYDVGEVAGLEPAEPGADAIRFLVMEHLEGESLADRLRRGGLPIADVLRYGIELADALDHAHRRSLVHRDLKPANVILTKEGTKLLDFGLSRLIAPPDSDFVSTRTSSTPPLTVEGTVLGTFPYMAPEQADGRDTDARSDIFSLGTMLYEMTTGRRPFDGSTAATVVGAILHTDPPPLSSLQPNAPPELERTVTQCLAKNPDDRWQSARDLMLELKRMPSQVASPAVRPPAATFRWKRTLVGASAIALVGMAIVVGNWLRVPAETPATRLSFSPPAGLTLADVRFAGPVTISPDGRQLLFVAAGSDGKQMLWVQSLDSTTARALAGTDAAAYPFWSWDNRSIGFFANGKLKRIDTAGGPPQTLCDAVLPRGGTWNRAGTIVFAANAGEHLYRVSAASGTPTALTFPRQNRESHWPKFLPDDQHFIYFGRRQKPGIYVGSLDPNETTKLVAAGLYVGAAYAPPGYLLLSSGGSVAGTLMAQSFDLDHLAVTGEPVTLADHVPFFPFYGLADFSVSDTGTILYGTRGVTPTSLVWFDRAKQVAVVPGASGYTRPVLSPDEKLIAADRADPETLSPDVWVIDAASGVTRRLTTNPGLDITNFWSPDGRQILYGSTREESGTNSYMKSLDGAGSEGALFETGERESRQVTDWTASDQLMVFARLDPKTQWDLWTKPAKSGGTDATTVPYLRTPFNEHDGRISPNNRWMVYSSDQSGRWEVYVGTFPTHAGNATRISTTGGIDPRWRRDGKEIFYVGENRMLTAVSVQSAPAFKAGQPHALFKLPIADDVTSAQHILGPMYAPTGDGQRFLVSAVVDGAPELNRILLNWPAMLRR